MNNLQRWLTCSGLALLCTILLAQTTQTSQEATPATTTTSTPSVSAATKGSIITIDGRMFVGIYQTGDDGPYPNRSLVIPDAKLRFTFKPSKDITIVNRFSNNNAASNGLDYFYIDFNNWAGPKSESILRLGKMKIDVGEEDWTDNPVESILITASAADVSGYDEGVNFRGRVPTVKRPLYYSFAVLNASKGVSVSSDGLATATKVGYAPNDNLYFSASYYETGDLLQPNGNLAETDLKIANMTAAPAGATDWQRRLWEVDARWGYGPTGIKPIIGAPPTPPFQLAAAYGQFRDTVTGPATDRDGSYWYVEGLYNATKKVYLASRYSEISLDDDVTATLNDSPVPVNSYTRLSLGIGYRLTQLTHVKAEYTMNDADGGTREPELNQIAVGVATKF